MKNVAKEKGQQRTDLENQLKKLEGNSDEDNLSKYNSVKNELDEIYDHIAIGTQIRSKCDWYEHREKSTKFFLNLERQRGSQNTMMLMIRNYRPITNGLC